MEKAKSAWQEALADLVTDPKELLSILALDPALYPQVAAASNLFKLKVPRKFLARIEKGNPKDPLLKQILPLGDELQIVTDYVEDPLLESKQNPLSGLLHKYESRVLITLTSACAVHCRYCFRRHFPYEENNAGTQAWSGIIKYIEQDKGINEVILSGGDPLAVSDRMLRQFTDQLSQLPQIKRLRIHTRLPIVLPERVTEDFIQWCKDLPMAGVIVVHTNHANEINEEVEKALKQLSASGVTILNQSVLLRGVNDDAKVLVALSERLFEAGVLPYYLHMPDKVAGTAHFDVPLAEAQSLFEKINQKLPGYLVPRLVREEPGAPSKTILSTALYTV